MTLEMTRVNVKYNQQSVEALYLVEFGDITSSEYRNGGVVVFETERVFGGDSGYYYVGSFNVKNNELSGTARIVKHNNDLPNAFGDNANSFTVNIGANILGNIIVGTMNRSDMPTVFLPIRFTKLEDLP